MKGVGGRDFFLVGSWRFLSSQRWYFPGFLVLGTDSCRQAGRLRKLYSAFVSWNLKLISFSQDCRVSVLRAPRLKFFLRRAAPQRPLPRGLKSQFITNELEWGELGGKRRGFCICLVLCNRNAGSLAADSCIACVLSSAYDWFPVCFSKNHVACFLLLKADLTRSAGIVILIGTNAFLVVRR